MRTSLTTTLLLALSTLTTSTHLRLLLPPLPTTNPNTLPPSTHATLTTLHTTLSAPLRTDNAFEWRNVSAGSYLLDVHCHTHVFGALRVDVGSEGDEGEKVKVWGTFRGNEWGNLGERVGVREMEGRVGVWEFEGKVLGRKEYLVERGGFSPLSLLKNPMILIAGVTMLIVFGMPYIMDNLDPELKAEFEERQKPSAGGQPANPLQNFDAAAWLAGSGTSTPKKTEVEKGVTR